MNIFLYMITQQIKRIGKSTPMELFFISGGVKAGFPSPAQDFMGEKIDLNRELVQHPFETFVVKVDGDSMKDAGITDGDRLIVDRSMAPEDDKIFVCCLNNEFTVKRLRIDKATKTVWLVPENDSFTPIEVKAEEENFIIWGRVVFAIKSY